MTPVFGFLADRYGRKPVLAPALFLFGLAGGLCALAPNYATLLLLRFLQGIGAASLSALNITLIGDMYTGQDRVAAMGYNASVLSLGTALYPALGGALAVFGWNYPFLLFLAAIPLGILVFLFLDSTRPRSEEQVLQYLQGVAGAAQPQVGFAFGCRHSHLRYSLWRMV